MSCALSLSLSLSAPIFSISTCSNTRVAPHLEVTAEKIRGDNCILSLHIILEPHKVNFSWICINHRRIQPTSTLVSTTFFHLLHLYDVTEGQKLEIYQEYHYVVYKCKEPLSMYYKYETHSHG